MSRLILMRHSRAERPPGLLDHQRPLASSGRADAAIAAARLGPHISGGPFVVLVSSAERTRQTWAEICAALPPASVLEESALYEATPRELLDLASMVGKADSAGSLLVIGHNPTIHAAALQVLNGRLDRDSELARRFPTSAFAVIDIPDWDTLTSTVGTLATFEIPRVGKDASS